MRNDQKLCRREKYVKIRKNKFNGDKIFTAPFYTLFFVGYEHRSVRSVREPRTV